MFPLLWFLSIHISKNCAAELLVAVLGLQRTSVVIANDHFLRNALTPRQAESADHLQALLHSKLTHAISCEEQATAPLHGIKDITWS